METVIVTRTFYRTEDGGEFDDPRLAAQHEWRTRFAKVLRDQLDIDDVRIAMVSRQLAAWVANTYHTPPIDEREIDRMLAEQLDDYEPCWGGEK